MPCWPVFLVVSSLSLSLYHISLVTNVYVSDDVSIILYWPYQSLQYWIQLSTCLCLYVGGSHDDQSCKLTTQHCLTFLHHFSRSNLIFECFGLRIFSGRDGSSSCQCRGRFPSRRQGSSALMLKMGVLPSDTKVWLKYLNYTTRTMSIISFSNLQIYNIPMMSTDD